MPRRRRLLHLLIALLTQSGLVAAQNHYFGGSIRGYQFFAFEEPILTDRRDSEIWLARLTEESAFSKRLKVEAHGLITLTSPPLTGSSQIAYRDSNRFLPLDWDIADCEDLNLHAGLDRLNFQLDFDQVRITVGRQAISWGVSYFWPALDLFAPFAPQQIDRDYKAGVDAVRVTVPLGAFSELEVLGGSLGPAASEDGAGAALIRWNMGSADLGFMGGKFHHDTVLGAFLTANVWGTGVRGEVSWTDSGDPADLERERSEFWRGSVGMTRQMTPSVGMVVEVAFNGYGTGEPEDYLDYLTADRILRGEVNGLGRSYTGVSINWMAHPLLVATGSVLTNWSDQSWLCVPTLAWSSSDNSEVILGGQIGFGKGLSNEGQIGSEYGLVPGSVFGAVRLYF